MAEGQGLGLFLINKILRFYGRQSRVERAKSQDGKQFKVFIKKVVMIIPLYK